MAMISGWNHHWSTRRVRAAIDARGAPPGPPGGRPPALPPGGRPPALPPRGAPGGRPPASPLSAGPAGRLRVCDMRTPAVLSPQRCARRSRADLYLLSNLSRIPTWGHPRRVVVAPGSPPPREFPPRRGPEVKSVLRIGLEPATGTRRVMTCATVGVGAGSKDQGARRPTMEALTDARC